MTMDFLTFARKRWSVRAYSQKPVEEEKVTENITGGNDSAYCR